MLPLFGSFKLHHDSPGLTMEEHENSLDQSREELLMEAWCLLEDEEEGGLLPLLTFPLIIKL